MGQLSSERSNALFKYHGAIFRNDRQSKLASRHSRTWDRTRSHTYAHTRRARRSPTPKPSSDDAKATDEAGTKTRDGTTRRTRT